MKVKNVSINIPRSQARVRRTGKNNLRFGKGVAIMADADVDG